MSSSDEAIDQTKEEPMDEESEPAFGPAFLGLHRIGTKLPPRPALPKPDTIQKLNARGMPARIRKKNKLFFDDDIVNDKPSPKPSPRKSGSVPASPSTSNSGDAIKKTPSKSTPQTRLLKRRRELKAKRDLIKAAAVASTSQSTELERANAQFDRKVSQKIGMRLRNLLKLPKAHKFVSYEWFYSTIDRPLFEGENDFQVCLRQSFPDLKTRMLSRPEWRKIRRIMGKPRRCSQTFFEEERQELERKRQKLRVVQARKNCDASFIQDLPSEVPLSLHVGAKVTARLRSGQDGIFTGVVDAVESSISSYRITFDRPGLGTHSIPDYEIYSNDPIESLPVSAIAKEFRPKKHVPYYGLSPLQKIGPHSSFPMKSARNQLNTSDPLLGGDSYPQMNKINELLALPKSSIGGFPLKLLELIVRMRKTLSAKQMKIMRLKNMNSEAEVYKSYGDPFPDDFQKRYANLIIGMEKLNRDMQEYLAQIQNCAKDVIKEPQALALLTPFYLREKCREMGKQTVEKNNGGAITDESMVKLISDLSMIMWVASNLNNNDQYSHVMKVLSSCMEETKSRLKPENIPIFQKSVQGHMLQIQTGLGLSQSKLDLSNAFDQ